MVSRLEGLRACCPRFQIEGGEVGINRVEASAFGLQGSWGAGKLGFRV